MNFGNLPDFLVSTDEDLELDLLPGALLLYESRCYFGNHLKGPETSWDIFVFQGKEYLKLWEVRGASCEGHF